MVKILIADDEQEVADIMARKIAAEGYEVVKAYDGLGAWKIICDESPDIIVLDINMPGRDGFEILKELRTNPPSSKWQPVILVSGRRELQDLKQGFDLEADHYLTKPCSANDVLKAIKLMIQLKPQHRTD